MNKITIFGVFFLIVLTIPSAFAESGDMQDVLKKLGIDPDNPAFTGNGIKIAILDQSFCVAEEGYPNDIQNVVFTKKFDNNASYLGDYYDCPSTNPTSGKISHGTNIAKIINEIAPNAELYLYQYQEIFDSNLLEVTQTNFANAFVQSAGLQNVDVIITSSSFDVPVLHVGSNEGYLTGTSVISNIASTVSATYDIPVIAAVANDGNGALSFKFIDSGEDINNQLTHKFQSNNSIQDAGLRISTAPNFVSPEIRMYWDGWPDKSYEYEMYLYDEQMTKQIKKGNLIDNTLPVSELKIPQSSSPKNYA